MSYRDFLTALRTLTVIPVPGPEGDFARSFFFFPLVGLVLGGIAWLAFTVLVPVFHEQTLIIALIVLALVSVATGFLHLDGLADSADAFGGGHTREDILRILKDSRIGSFGAIALFFDLVAKLLAYGALLDRGRIDVVACSLILSRAVQPLFFAYLPYARGPEGKSFAFSGSQTKARALTIELAAVAALVWLFLCFKVGALAILISLFAVLLCGVYFRKKIDGITGDCVGAATEVFEIVFLLAALSA
jgi:adenosylcobinamide-GDP ribazoletransferase